MTKQDRQKTLPRRYSSYVRTTVPLQHRSGRFIRHFLGTDFTVNEATDLTPSILRLASVAVQVDVSGRAC
jgi:hypothetical protein